MAIPDHQFDFPLACPIDGSSLCLDGGSLACGEGHRFDVAKEGYANLLPVQFKNSRDPGDSKEMVQARRKTLESGAFAHVADALAGVAAQHAGRVERPINLLDAGCGEGYYLGQVSKHLEPGVANCIGLDISKWAVRAAAKRYKPLCWLVATNRRLPVRAGDIDMIACLFGFPVWSHWAELQRPGQQVVMIDPARDHLKELREIIYEDVRYHDAPALDGAFDAGYRLEASEIVSRQVLLDGMELIASLVSMTPHAHRMGEAGAAALAGLERLEVTVAVELRRLERI
ncbi:putative RNA methyltransferase [Aestuariispira insulae]|uniref:23S rRNA m(1)G-745 methyltransferase n=1 Tax=Aestuariispira insulae TaxID=1461337 RepID=A0A3D9HR77_9PROT|nr:methyltransferase domain-containing protein [Aestuariispira insulae]RED52017.1 23S rRNA m(1)G-745 methyltransferase [Aestuariispira insulae]